MIAAAGDLHAVGTVTPVHLRAYRILIAALLFAMTATFAFLISSEGVPPIELLLLFAGLVIIAENRDRIFGDETSISGSIAVALAAVVAFRSSTSLLGPLTCAACAGLYWPHIRARSFDKIIVNAASIGFSALAAAGAIEIASVEPSTSATDLLVLAIPAVVVYWLVNSCVLAVAISLLHGTELGRNAGLLVRSETSMLGFALVGGVAGLALLRHGYWVGAASVMLLVVLLDLFVIAPRSWLVARVSPVTGSRVSAHVWRFSCAFVFAVFGTERVGLGLGALAAVAGALVLTLLIALLGVHRRMGIWDVHLALGVAMLDAPMVVVFAVAGALAVTLEIWVALAVVAVALAIAGAMSRLRRRKLRRAEQVDARLAAALELAVLDSRDPSTSTR